MLLVVDDPWETRTTGLAEVGKICKYARFGAQGALFWLFSCIGNRKINAHNEHFAADNHSARCAVTCLTGFVTTLRPRYLVRLLHCARRPTVLSGGRSAASTV